MKKTTRHFKNCLGVFQGGGCKALAFIGAYKDAAERGVFFSGVAGTSAGALVASLIAAGASPEKLSNIVKATDFQSFKQKPNQIPIPADADWGRHLLVATKRHRAVARFMTHLGLFSSAKIEEWLEGQLKELLGFTETRPVEFRDLNIPLHVVATDLSGARPIVWNSELTPGASVAYAVRCSCTIPIYFQPVDSVYVDGGIVSNLPSFVLNNRQIGGFEKLLCFTFSSNGTAPSSRIAEHPLIEAYLKDLISAVIDGAVHIQTELQTNLHVIEIPDLPLQTLDFDKINSDSLKQMFAAGEGAAARFFDEEVIHIRTSASARTILTTETEALNRIVREEPDEGDEIVFALKSTRYVYNLFPTLLNWRLQGTRITFLTEPVIGSGGSVQHEHFRRLVLAAMGVTVAVSGGLPFEAAFFKKNDLPNGAIVFDERRLEADAACFGVRYERTYDSTAIEALYTDVHACLFNEKTSRKCLKTRIEIKTGGVDELLKRLKTVREYGRRVRLSLEEVDVSKIIFLTKYIKSYKYHQIKRIFEIYERNGIDLFESVQIRYSGDIDVIMAVTPPVAEEHGGNYYLLEGNSRLTYLIKERRARTLKMVVARDVTDGLPTTGKVRAEQLLITDEGKVGSARFERFNPELFRRIEEAVHHPSLYTDYYRG